MPGRRRRIDPRRGRLAYPGCRLFQSAIMDLVTEGTDNSDRGVPCVANSREVSCLPAEPRRPLPHRRFLTEPGEQLTMPGSVANPT